MRTLPFTPACTSLVAALVFAASAAAQPAPNTPAPSPATGATGMAAVTETDQKFMMETAVGGMAEVEMGKLAQQRSSNPKVKQFAARMVTDHGKANGELKALAAKKHVTVPSALPQTQKDDMAQMGKLAGADFDKAYAAHMAGDHQKTVAAFEKQAQGNGDAEIKAWAAKTLPTLHEHLAATGTLDPAATTK